jgi:ribose transport system substrate-binding protein
MLEHDYVQIIIRGGYFPVKKIVAIVIGCLMVFGMVACSAPAPVTSQAAPASAAAVVSAAAGTSQAAAPAAGDKKDQVYIGVFCLGNLEYFIDHRLGFWGAIDELGVTGEYTGPADADATSQINAFEQAIAKKPAGILTLPVDQSLVQVIDKAVDAGIPVVCVDNDFPQAKRYTVCGTGNEAAGQKGGKRVVEDLGGKGKIGLIYHPGSTNLEQRIQGYKDIFAEYPGIEIVGSGDTQSDITVSATNAAAMLQAHPDLSAFICVDAVGGQGAAQAVKEAGKAGQVKIYAFDRDGATLQAIIDGTISFTIVQNTALMSYYAVQVLYSLHNNTDRLGFTPEMGVVPAPNSIDTGSIIVDKSNAQLFMRAKGVTGNEFHEKK